VSEQADFAAVLRHYPLHTKRMWRLTAGHINLTYFVEAAEGHFTLQRLHPILDPEVHNDIEVVTAHLASHGVQTPRLLHTLADGLWTPDAEGRVWRVLTFLEGETVDRASSPSRCRAAGELLGRVHAALWDLQHRYSHRRSGVHDTPGHLAHLQSALQDHRDHPAYDPVALVAEAILTGVSSLALPFGLPLRHVHGDPKISNFIFGPDGEARAMIDLDTFARMPLPLELGDALRSWCAPSGEETEQPVSLDHFEAAVAGYAQGIGFLPERAEREAFPLATALIAFELAARFCTDAIEERYFAWDPKRYSSSTAHNLARARSQLAMAKSILNELDSLEAFVRRSWRNGPPSC